MKKAKWLSGEALQIAVNKREAKSKEEKRRYKHLNTEFQRIARRDNKAFLSDQCKEIEENDRMGKTRDLFKKIRDTKGTFHTKMGLIKDRNGMGLTEACPASSTGGGGRPGQIHQQQLHQRRGGRPDQLHRRRGGRWEDGGCNTPSAGGGRSTSWW